MSKNQYRPDRDGAHKQEFRRSKKRILMTQDTCAICGRPVDKSLKFPDPLSATVDHIIPIAKGGHPSDVANLQLAHLKCNRWKADKLMQTKAKPLAADEEINNKILPWSYDWENYKAK